MSGGTELQDLTNTVIDTETAVKSLETSLTGWLHTDTQTEGLTLRELEGLDKALQRTRGEHTNNLAKLTELDKDIITQSYKRLRMMKLQMKPLKGIQGPVFKT